MQPPRIQFPGFRLLVGGASALLPLLAATAAIAQSRNDDSYDQGSYSDRSYDSGRQTYRPNDSYGGSGSSRSDSYAPSRSARNDAYHPPGEYDDQGDGRRDSFSGSRGNSYAPPPGRDYDRSGYPEPQPPPPQHSNYYEQGEIVAAGHSFFGAVSKGLASAVEYAFKSQGRPNGYILGEDAGGAFIVGLRYGEGKLFTKDAGNHKVFWQGPSLGYDAGAEGSKTMVLVYNLHDPEEIYNQFGGAEGSAYLVGGVSVQFQTYGHVTLGVIRSGVGVRLGANIGYSKYSRSPTWNPL